jgi:hypothetical protein
MKGGAGESLKDRWRVAEGRVRSGWQLPTVATSSSGEDRAAVANCLVLTKADADLASSVEQ